MGNFASTFTLETFRRAVLRSQGRFGTVGPRVKQTDFCWLVLGFHPALVFPIKQALRGINTNAVLNEWFAWAWLKALAADHVIRFARSQVRWLCWSSRVLRTARLPSNRPGMPKTMNCFDYV